MQVTAALPGTTTGRRDRAGQSKGWQGGTGRHRTVVTDVTTTTTTTSTSTTTSRVAVAGRGDVSLISRRLDWLHA
ncbi:hypothetical protein E2C01_024414 [Portunus trituberculatus]|uniref:Uncharacterized protein n=1 Tax=Portunus trituberculatus TaxID=210409 RepID=A0A5B7ECM5_PORTR|nr:hypothetical protein [Portunus trituberculatus]